MLKTLDDATLEPIFKEYSTISDDLHSHLAWRFHKDMLLAATDFRPWWPCIFKQDAPQAPSNVASGMSEEVRKLVTASAQLSSKGPERAHAVDTLIAMMRAYGAGADWSVAHYGGLAVRASMAMGDSSRAGKRLTAACQISGTADLLYLKRILDREEQTSIESKSSELAQAGQ